MFRKVRGVLGKRTATARRLWGQAWFLLANKRLGKRKFSLPRLLSWSLALATAASMVVLSTFLLTQTNTETSYAAGPYVASCSWIML